MLINKIQGTFIRYHSFREARTVQVMFGGDAGSDMENMLEQQLQDLEDSKEKLETSYEREERLWKDTKVYMTRSVENYYGISKIFLPKFLLSYFTILKSHSFFLSLSLPIPAYLCFVLYHLYSTTEFV